MLIIAILAQFINVRFGSVPAAECITRPAAAHGCGFKWSMQHLVSNPREEDVIEDGQGSDDVLERHIFTECDEVAEFFPWPPEC